MAEPAGPTQRFYRAPCPGCGAPVEFRSAQSTHAVCAYCQSTVVRTGEALARIGKMADVFDDHSPLQLGASGRWDGQGFTLIGRHQYKSSTGIWAEWHALFDDGTSGTLGEDNGAYVFTRPFELARELPAAEHFRVGATTAIDGKAFEVTVNDQASLVSAQGELPRMPPLGQPFAIVELRSADGEVLAIEYVAAGATLSRGKAIDLEALELKGLKDESARADQGRQFACPHCGATVEIKLDQTKSITCGSCRSLIDLSAGTGAELRHAVQDEPVAPVIPLGSVGKLQGNHWQVVGFQHRMGHEAGDDEHFGWSEYLLFHRKKGFQFLVDASDGWSLVKPITGSATLSGDGQSARYLNVKYALDSAYEAETTYVEGEFYWPVERGQKTSNRDYVNARNLLSLEQTPKERNWSAGTRLDAKVVAEAFGLGDKLAAFQRDDAKPVSSASGMGCAVMLVIIVLIVLVLWLVLASTRCDPNVEDCRAQSSGSSSRSSGGSFGGSSGGGGHK